MDNASESEFKNLNSIATQFASTTSTFLAILLRHAHPCKQVRVPCNSTAKFKNKFLSCSRSVMDSTAVFGTARSGSSPDGSTKYTN